MLQNRTFSSSISSTVSAEWAAPQQHAVARGAILRERWHVLTQTLRLPDNLQSFLLFTLVVMIICGGLTLHLQLSTTILQDRFRLEKLQAEEQAIKEQSSNLVWAIVQETELNKVKVRATALGYQPALQRNYIFAPTDIAQNEMTLGNVQPMDSQVAVTQSGE
jgi:hypothetical protein